MIDIPVYKAEREAGLSRAIKDHSFISYASLVETANSANSPDALRIIANEVLQKPPRAKATNGDFDLHFLKSVLVSTGWNKNMDVFDRVEVWQARATPEDKMLNLEHDQRDILGHITENYVVGSDFAKLDSNLAIDELPDKFHIITGAVIYKEWEDPDQDERIKKIIAEIAEGRFFVSMEALFRGFDYGIIHPDKTMSVVARNEQTAFLTKHLKAYGGTGEYNDYKVGRLMRNITFSGKGLVRKPANPESIIFTDTEIFPANASTQQTLGYNHELDKVASKQKEEKIMAVANDNEERDRQAKLEAKLNELMKAREDSLNLRITELENKVKASDEAKANVEKKLQETEATLKSTSAELVEVSEAYKQYTRTLAIMNRLDASQEEAEALYKDVFATMSDDAVERHLAKMEDYLSKKRAEYEKAPAEESPAGPGKKGAIDGAGSEQKPRFETVPATQPKKAVVKKIGMPGIKASPIAPVNIKASLENAEPELDPSLAIAENVTEKIEKVRASISSYLADNYLQMKAAAAAATEE